MIDFPDGWGQKAEEPVEKRKPKPKAKKPASRPLNSVENKLNREARKAGKPEPYK